MAEEQKHVVSIKFNALKSYMKANILMIIYCGTCVAIYWISFEIVTQTSQSEHDQQNRAAAIRRFHMLQFVIDIDEESNIWLQVNLNDYYAIKW